MLQGPVISTGASGKTFDKRVPRLKRQTVTYDCKLNIKEYLLSIEKYQEFVELIYLAWSDDVKYLSEFVEQNAFPIKIIDAGQPLSEYRPKWQFEAFCGKEITTYLDKNHYDIVLRIRADVLLDVDLLLESINYINTLKDWQVLVAYRASLGRLQDFYFGGTSAGLMRFCKNINTGFPDVHGPHYDALINQSILRKYKFLHKLKRRHIRFITRIIGLIIQVPLNREVFDTLKWRGEALFSTSQYK